MQVPEEVYKAAQLWAQAESNRRSEKVSRAELRFRFVELDPPVMSITQADRIYEGLTLPECQEVQHAVCEWALATSRSRGSGPSRDALFARFRKYEDKGFPASLTFREARNIAREIDKT